MTAHEINYLISVYEKLASDTTFNKETKERIKTNIKVLKEKLEEEKNYDL